jgi:hypothetical protein
MTKEERKEYGRKWRLANLEKHKEYGRKRYLANPEKSKETSRKYHLANPEKVKEASRKHYLANPEKVKERTKQYQRNRKKTDPLFKLSHNMRSRTGMFIKSSGFKKSCKTFDMIGCTPEYLKQHLEKQFVDGMTWDNHGDWHIDHIVPLASATNKEEMIKLCHYTNLQPLWAIDNIIKGGKISDMNIEKIKKLVNEIRSADIIRVNDGVDVGKK